MREFSSLGKFSEHLLTLAVTEALALHKGLELCAKHVEKTAKDEIGTYQDAVGNFPAWAELSDATKADRVAQGFTENDPLLRTGELRDSISHKTHWLEAEIGSTSDIMLWQELGTEKIPPRPVLGPAAVHNSARIKEILGAAAVSGLIGSSVISRELGYDFETKD